MKQLLIGFSALVMLLLGGCATSSSPTPKNSLDFPSIVELKKGCDLNVAIKCHQLGNIYTMDKKVKQDQSKALKYFAKACDLNDMLSCSNFGALYLGWKGKGNMSKAVKYMTKACNANHATGCYNLAFAYLPKHIGGFPESTVNYKKAIKYFSKACKLKENQGCIELKKLILYMEDSLVM